MSEVIKAAFAYLDHEHPTVRTALEEIHQLQELARRTVSGQEAPKRASEDEQAAILEAVPPFLDIEPVAWTKAEVLEAMTENDGSWVWKYDPKQPVESDDIFLYAAPIPATELSKPDVTVTVEEASLQTVRSILTDSSIEHLAVRVNNALTFIDACLDAAAKEG